MAADTFDGDGGGAGSKGDGCDLVCIAGTTPLSPASPAVATLKLSGAEESWLAGHEGTTVCHCFQAFDGKGGGGGGGGGGRDAGEGDGRSNVALCG